MIHERSPDSLRWFEVDPARYPFDSASAEQVVRTLEPARHVPQPPNAPLYSEAWRAWSDREAQLWADNMSFALVERFGAWAIGWRWTRGEGDFDGGPVESWCCTSHSVKTPDETLDRVAAALCEWRDWLEFLAQWFAEYRLDSEGVDERLVQWDCAARGLIHQVVERTRCDSTWYNHCHLVLTWFLSRWGVAPAIAEGLVEEAIGGRFSSWTGPKPGLVDDIAATLALSMCDGVAPVEAVPDHLERGLAVRATVPWREAAKDSTDEPVMPSRDGAIADIRAFDGGVSPARAKGLLAALAEVRADAARGASLDFERMRRWQRHVLKAERLPTVKAKQLPAFRTMPAFAKRGGERYGIGPDTRERFDACLAESLRAAGDLPLVARAARAYLDVCYFHPFDDGNARAAFLTLVFVLAREGVALDDVRGLRRISYQADDPQDAQTLTRCVSLHLEWTRRRA